MGKMFNEGFVKYNGANIHYIDLNSEKDKALVFLHGNGEDLNIFKYQYKYFLSKYRIIGIDSRGHGQSTCDNSELSLLNMAEDVCGVLNELKIEKADFVGFSDGANVLLYLALCNPKYIDKMILIGANYNTSGLINTTKVLSKAEYFASYLLTGLKLSDEYKDKMKQLNLMLKEPNIKRSQLNEIDIPTLVMASEYDEIKKSHTISLHKNIKDSELCIIKKADHYSIVKKPNTVNNNIDEFLSK